MLFNTYEPGKFAFSQEEFDKSKIKWGILGVPFDSTASYKTTSRYGPMVVREASFGFEKFNLPLNKNLDTIFYDFGDINVVNGNCYNTCSIIEDVVNELNELDIKPILIGGEHSISIGSIKAIKNKYDDLTVIHLDAHRDLADEFIGENYSHATVMRRVHELGLNKLIQIGNRSSSYEEELFVKSQNNILTEIDKITTPIYISIDLDVLDPSIAPNVGNPTANGLFINDIREIFSKIDLNNVVGLDVVETSTNKLGDVTAIMAAQIIYDFLTMV